MLTTLGGMISLRELPAMKYTPQTIVLLTGLSLFFLACKSSDGDSGGSECARVVDKELECGSESDEEKAKLREARSYSIERCQEDKSEPYYKEGIDCLAKTSCDEFNACKRGSAKAETVAEIEDILKSGTASAGMVACYSDLKSYNEVSTYKAVCDKAFEAVFADLDNAETRKTARLACISIVDVQQWRASSETLSQGCKVLVADLKGRLTKQRDAESEYDYSICMAYTDLVDELHPEEKAAAARLCKEAEAAADFTEAHKLATASLSDKSADIPYQCKYFLELKDLKDSEWFAGKSKELASLCFGELGTLVLKSVGSTCKTDARDTHRFATEFSLGEDDDALGTLLKKTARKCE